MADLERICSKPLGSKRYSSSVSKKMRAHLPESPRQRIGISCFLLLVMEEHCAMKQARQYR